MSDYANAYELLSQVRYGINEHSTALVQGTETSGKWSNAELLRHINDAQYFIWAIVFKQFPEYFLKMADVTFTDSVAVLPGDCFKIKELTGSFAGIGASEEEIVETDYTIDDEGNYIVTP